jgi:hypothetical protein
MTLYARRRGQALAGSLLFVVLACVAALHGARTLAYLLVALAVGCVAYVSRRPRLSADAGGITVVNLARTTRIPWSDVAGFGVGWAGSERCLAVRRRDGSTVNAWVVTDDLRSGYTTDQVDAIVADLRDRLAAAGEVEDDEGSVAAGETRGRRLAGSIPAVTWVCLCVFLVVLGAVVAYRAMVSTPAAYAALRSRGAAATARFAGCKVVDIRTQTCSLSLTYAGRTRTWRYAEDFPQFRHLAVGAAVPVLVDPAHPASVYTVHDVESNDNAGFGVLAAFGVVFAALGLVGLGFFVWLRAKLSRARRRLPAGARPVEPWSGA